MARAKKLRAAGAADTTLRIAATPDPLLARAAFMRQVGLSFSGARDTYVVLGYDRIITNRQYRERYARGGIAARIVDAMPNATWRGTVELREDEELDDYTKFEQAWKDLDQRLQIQAKLQRVDKLAGLSQYAVLLIGTSVYGPMDQELPRGGPEKLIYLTPFAGGGGPTGQSRNPSSGGDDADATISELDVNPTSPRFGLPLFYTLRRINVNSSSGLDRVHWSRIIHIAEGALEDEVYGQPVLERVWNLLDDLDKVTGGGAEAFWLRANQGMHIDINKDMALADAENQVVALREQMENYKHQLTRWIRTRGVEVEPLGSDVANFQSPADAILTQIAGARAMPKRILTGSEMGELASSQDRDNWKDQINGRQTGYAGPYIVRPLVDRLISYGYLPTPKGGPLVYEVKWPHIQTLTEQERAEGAQKWASTNQTYGDVVFTDEQIRDKWYDMEPLTEAEKAKARPKPPEPAPLPAEAAKDEPKTFPRAAEQYDEELVEVLRAAIEAGNTDVIDRIIGIQHD